VKSRSTIAGFIFLFFFLSYVISYDHLIAAKSPLESIHKPVSINTSAHSPFGDHHFILNVYAVIPRKSFDSDQYLEVGPNIGALAAVGTDTSLLNGSIARPLSNSTRNTYYDVRGVNIGALAAVAADKAFIDATITQLNGSAITIQIAKNTIRAGDNQTITITLVDKLTKKGLEKASVDGWVSASSGISTSFFSGLTNSSGIMSSTVHVANGTALGKATIFVEAYHKGYQRSSKSNSFLIVS